MPDTAGSNGPPPHWAMAPDGSPRTTRQAYEVLGDDADVTSTRHLAWLCVAAMWSGCCYEVLMHLMRLRRRSVWSEAYALNTRDAFARAQDADQRLVSLQRWPWALLIATVVILAVWTAAALRNAGRRGVAVNARVGWAWMIPLFGPPRAINALAHSVSSVDYSDRRLKLWLVCGYVGLPLTFLLMIASMSAFNTITDIDSALAALARDVQVGYALLVLNAVWAVLGTRAVLHADRAISGTRHAR